MNDQDDGVHLKKDVRPGTATEETLSLGTKVLKGIYVLKVRQKNYFILILIDSDDDTKQFDL